MNFICLGVISSHQFLAQTLAEKDVNSEVIRRLSGGSRISQTGGSNNKEGRQHIIMLAMFS